MLVRTTYKLWGPVSPSPYGCCAYVFRGHRMLASQEYLSDTELLCVAYTMLSLGTEVIAPNPPNIAQELLSNPSLSPKYVILNDHERRNGYYFALFRRIR